MSQTSSRTMSSRSFTKDESGYSGAGPMAGFARGTQAISIRSSAASTSDFLNLTARPILKYGISPAMRQQ